MRSLAEQDDRQYPYRVMLAIRVVYFALIDSGKHEFCDDCIFNLERTMCSLFVQMLQE
jgi:hypothetical protein